VPGTSAKARLARAGLRCSDVLKGQAGTKLFLIGGPGRIDFASGCVTVWHFNSFVGVEVRMKPGAPKHEEFVSEPIVPLPGTFDAQAMSIGEPGLPGLFAWRDHRYKVARLMSKWKSSKADRGEMYLKRHWYRIETETGEHMTLYCLRQASSAKKAKSRWWVYSVTR
jgi:hypothetical protein